MLMTNDNVRLFPQDRILAKTILPLIPSWVRPNHVTVARLVLTPLVLFFLWLEIWAVALPLFLITALTDALDGSLARVRRQITLWGTVADPTADKILIGSVVILFVAREVNPMFAAIIVLVEVVIALAGLHRRNKGIYNSANEFGKIKMCLQVTGVSLLLLARLLGFELAVPFALGTLGLALVFALVSLVTYGI